MLDCEVLLPLGMEEIIQQFYKAFDDGDVEHMVGHYHDDIVFQDPAFGQLKGERAKNMWRMLRGSQKGREFKVAASEIEVNDQAGRARWDAYYHFSRTGRKVHNIIYAEFEFKDGKIIKHTDTFDLHRWAKQAMGFKGWLLGGTGFFRRKLQAQTNALLDRFEAKR